jgi:hypothetical protein
MDQGVFTWGEKLERPRRLPNRRRFRCQLSRPGANSTVKFFETLAAQSPQSLHLIDSSIVRAHQHAAGGKRGPGSPPLAVLVED